MPEVKFPVSECVFAWDAAYHQDDTQVTVRIKLNPADDVGSATLTACKARWKQGIEQAWSGQFGCCESPGCSNQRDIELTVDWVSQDEHLAVTVKQGPGRSNLTLWHTTDSGQVAAHEVGHLLGNVDEYVDTLCPLRSPVGTGTLMDDVSGPVVARHCKRFCTQIGEMVV